MGKRREKQKKSSEDFRKTTDVLRESSELFVRTAESADSALSTSGKKDVDARFP